MPAGQYWNECGNMNISFHVGNGHIMRRYNKCKAYVVALLCLFCLVVHVFLCYVSCCPSSACSVSCIFFFFSTVLKIVFPISDKSKQTGYLCPRGGLFDLVSCPHFLMEIIIYFSFCIVFRFQHTILLSLFTFVLINQVIASLITHQWYCQNFPGYGQKRRAVFPYLLWERTVMCFGHVLLNMEWRWTYTLHTFSV